MDETSILIERGKALVSAVHRTYYQRGITTLFKPIRRIATISYLELFPFREILVLPVSSNSDNLPNFTSSEPDSKLLLRFFNFFFNSCVASIDAEEPRALKTVYLLDDECELLAAENLSGFEVSDNECEVSDLSATFIIRCPVSLINSALGGSMPS